MALTELQKFISTYKSAALWTSYDYKGISLDNYKYYGFVFTRESEKKILADCTKFFTTNYELFDGRFYQAGHDFWLTRNRHGAGFWETSNWPEEVGHVLTDSAHTFSELYIWPNRKKFHL